MSAITARGTASRGKVGCDSAREEKLGKGYVAVTLLGRINSCRTPLVLHLREVVV